MPADTLSYRRTILVMELELPEDIRPWVEARAAQLFRGDVSEAIVYLLREKQVHEEWLLSKPSLRRHDGTDMWAGLGRPVPGIPEAG
jgi:hypothetical protein